ncbi:MAG: hypothetical protein JWN86_372 [Planctomycetota bacterium]|nr:hypothetical protein [Planctomycetota bacterium]
MSAIDPEVRPRRGSAVPVGRGLVRFLCSSNPFYAISAVLVLLGLRSSYDPGAAAFPTWALLAGLSAYTMLLAGTACFLVRRGAVWDDVRTLVLLVAMVLLAIPAFFDDILARDPRLGIGCELGGLLFAVLISEAMLRGLALRLPAGFRVPYHLTLALFFLHPVALVPLLRSADDPALMWALFGFPAAAGAVALTLLPATRRGPAYVAKNGSPWRWPLYPWSLFALMSVGVCARAFSLCLAVNYSGGTSGYEGIDTTIFGPYFLIPFGMAIAILLLESGIATKSRLAMRTALAMPILLVGLAALGHRSDPAYQRFLQLFADGAGGSPMYVALVATALYYAVATWRRVPGSVDFLTAAIVAMSVVGPKTLDGSDLISPTAPPLLAASAIQIVLAISRRSSWRAILAVVGLTTATAVGPIGWETAMRHFAAAHLALAGAMLIGGIFRGEVARFLRGISALVLAFAATVPIWYAPTSISEDLFRVYPIVPIIAALGYGHFLGGKLFFLAATAGISCWISIFGGRTYAALRRSVVGLDQIALGLLFFSLAASISLIKAGARPGRALWHRARAMVMPDESRLGTDSLDEATVEL